MVYQGNHSAKNSTGTRGSRPTHKILKKCERKIGGGGGGGVVVVMEGRSYAVVFSRFGNHKEIIFTLDGNNGPCANPVQTLTAMKSGTYNEYNQTSIDDKLET